ncbi:hypothetical protein BFV94_2339 [Alteromonas macleodii]|uniref:Transposase n=1 Tax=Alteromonas macleodii TaxID=28108 RepID=A0AB36FWK2_ALTMA|nr:hypothetical protein BFV93_2334 [Alteromonas macleodii]OES31149.1 hypothetical protein BFV95_2340 [Alteromonas macleodii]OES31847.1 hypothetical protein BFV94_2339 [Alteromonas macleodii]OES41039.1 hypothetical protein BFV96_2325 [Alteromonas macleodii]
MWLINSHLVKKVVLKAEILQKGHRIWLCIAIISGYVNQPDRP